MEENEGASPRMADESRVPCQSRLRSPMSPRDTPEGESMQQSHMGDKDQHHPGPHGQHQGQHQAHHQVQRAQHSQAEQQIPGKEHAQASQQTQDGQQIKDNHQPHDSHTNWGFLPHNGHGQHQSPQQYHENLGSPSYTQQGNYPPLTMAPPPGCVWATTYAGAVQRLNACLMELEGNKMKMQQFADSAVSHFEKLKRELEESKKHQYDAEKQAEESRVQNEKAWKKKAEQFQQQEAKLQLHLERGEKAESKVQHLEDRLEASSKELEVEKALKVQAQRQAAEKHKHWKQAANELRKKAIAPPAPNQLTDEYLVNEMQKLRYTICNFAVNYFGGPPCDMDPNQLKNTEWRDEIATILPDADWILQYIMSNEKGPSIAQALVWGVLRVCVFGSFFWGGKLGKALQALESSLAPDLEDPSVSDSVKKYCKWRAESASLLLASMSGDDGNPIPNEALESRKLRCLKYMRYLIDRFLRKSDHTDKSYVADLNQILDQALALDKEMSVQVSQVVLLFRDVRPLLHFQQDEMELEHGETASTAEQQVLLVVSPGMKRLGRSSGEDFDQERILLPMKVSCSPGTQHMVTRAASNWTRFRAMNPFF